MLKQSLATLAILGLLTGCSSPQAATNLDAKQLKLQVPQDATSLHLDSQNSQLSWMANKINGTTHKGTVSIAKGALFMQKQEISGGEFIIDMTQITNLDDDGSSSQTLIQHLMSEDFFAVSNFPSAHLKITQITPNLKHLYQIQADLTIKDQTHPIEFDAKIEPKLGTASAKFKIDRTRWGIQYGSGQFFKELADNIIKDEIRFTLDLKFQ